MVDERVAPHPSQSTETTKDLKVKIPIRHVQRLHAVKVLTGRELQQIVTEALDAYFADKE